MIAPRYLLSALAALVLALMFLVVAQTPVEPWGDEAMLLANLLMPDLDLFTPLPYYEQAAPVGYLWLARMLLHLFGSEPPFHVLRFLSAAFVGLGILLLLTVRSIRRDGVAAAILVALLLGSPMIWTYAGEIKQYSAEFFSSALVMASGLPLAKRSDPGALALFLLSVIVAGLVSFTVPVVVAGMLGGLLILRLIRVPDTADPLTPAFVITGALALLYLGTLYLVLNRDLVAWQMQAYAHVYNSDTDHGIVRLLLKRFNHVLDAVVAAFGSAWLSEIRRLLHQGGLPLGLSYHVVRLIALLLFAALVWIARKRAPATVAVTLSVFAAVATLQMLGILNLPYERHAIFLIPFSATLTAISVAYLLEERLFPSVGALVAGLVLITGLSFGVGRALDRQTQEVGKLLTRIRDTAPDVPVWINGSGQPVFELLSPRPAQVLGEMDATSASIAWLVRGGEALDPAQHGEAWLANPDYPKTIATEAAGAPRLWLLFNNDASAQDRIPFLEVAAETVGPCKPEIESWSAGLYFCARQDQVPPPGN